MNGRQFPFGPQGNPLLQVLSVLVFGVVLVGAVIMGAVVLAAVVGLAVIAGVIFSIRLWWLRRKLGGPDVFGDGSQRPDSHSSRDTHLIEGEYEIIDSDEEPAERRRRR